MFKKPVAIALASLFVLPAAAYAVRYEPPVSTEVSRRFEAPVHRWSAGNRGLEYRVENGVDVRAAADGKVVFAGPVAGDLFVTVSHLDGVRTSYSYLSKVGVGVGQDIEAGAVLGQAGDRFQFGARRGKQYVDPELLFSGGRTHLVPLDGPPAPG